VRNLKRTTCTCACALLALNTFAQQASDDLSPAEKIYGLSLFWKEAKDHFVFFDRLPHIDWDKEYREAIPRVLATKSTWEYYQELIRFSALLNDGHTGLLRTPPPKAGEKRFLPPPLALAVFDRRVYVINVRQPVNKEIPLGSEVLARDGKSIGDCIREQLPYVTGSTEQLRWQSAAMRALSAWEDATVKITMRTPQQEPRDVSLIYSSSTLGPYAHKPVGWSPGIVSYRDLGDGLAYVALNSFNDPKVVEEFEKLIPTLKQAKGLIVDLRNNGGGSDFVGQKILQHWTPDVFQGFAWKTRVVNSAYRAWGKMVPADDAHLNNEQKEQLRHFTGDAWYQQEPQTFQGSADAELLMPKVILTGPRTASAAEDFLIYTDRMAVVTTVGERTCGSSGQPYVFDLPGGGQARICTQRITYPDGREFVGIGIPPNVEVKLTLEDLMSDHDVVLEKGIEVLKSKTS